MSVRKILKKKAEEDLRSLETERDREVLQRLIDSVEKKKKPKKQKRIGGK